MKTGSNLPIASELGKIFFRNSAASFAMYPDESFCELEKLPCEMLTQSKWETTNLITFRSQLIQKMFYRRRWNFTDKDCKTINTIIIITILKQATKTLISA